VHFPHNRIYHRLVAEQGFTGAALTVRRYVRLIKAKLGINRPGAFVPCDPEAGHEGEADWGTATAILAGEAVQLKFFCMRSKYSGKPFVRFYPCERQQAFFDGHVHAFAFYGGVFPVLIYDNLTVAVRKVLQGRDRIEQDSFARFKAYYSFESRFCNPDSGNEKGGVEGLVGALPVAITWSRFLKQRALRNSTNDCWCSVPHTAITLWLAVNGRLPNFLMKKRVIF